MAERRVDTALGALVAVAKYYGIPAEYEQIKRAYVVNPEGMDSLTLLRAARDIGLKGREFSIGAEQLASIPYPAIAVLAGNQYVLLLRHEGTQISLHDPISGRSVTAPLDKFLDRWTGTVILIARRYTLERVKQKFGLLWFAPQVVRYKKTTGVGAGLIIVASVAWPGYAVVYPGDHRSRFGSPQSEHTDIMIIGMLAINLFTIWLTALRAYLFTHTTSKIDAVLSSQLFRHVTSLPLSHFDRWQAGDVVSRLGELEKSAAS